MSGFRGADPDGVHSLAATMDEAGMALTVAAGTAYTILDGSGREATADRVGTRLSGVVRRLSGDAADLRRRAELVRRADSLASIAGVPRALAEQAWLEGSFALEAPIGLLDWDGALERWSTGPRLDDVVGASPEEVSAMLASVSQRALSRIVLAAPEIVGGLDGAPPELRYAANRILLQRELERLDAVAAEMTATLAVAPSHGDVADPWWGLEREIVRHELAAVEEQITRYRTWAEDDRQILLFDPSGDGRVAEVFGDLATASNVAVVVPGITNDIGNFGPPDGEGFRDTAAQLQSAAVALDGSVATIAWLGYDTPDGADAVLRGAANDGHDDLIRFLDGLVAANDLHLTVIGHSYGSLVTGMAAGVGIPADEVVFVGSPGTSLDHAGDANLPPGGEVWAGLASWDMIGAGVSVVPDSLWEATLSIPGRYIWDVITTGDRAVEDLWHGTNPAHESFGAVEFTTDGATGHSQYFDPGTESLENLARIVTGLTPQVTVVSFEPAELAPGPLGSPGEEWIEPGWGGELV